MVLNLKVSNPLISDLELTYLAQNVSATATLPVISSQFFSATTEFVLIGNERYDNAEIKQISSISGNNIVLLSAVQNEHVTGEKVRKVQYNQIQIYKKASGASTFSLLTTVSITYNNPQGETVYIDSVGTSADTYKVKYYNSLTFISSDYSSELTGTTVPSGSAYLSLDEFRDMTGVNDSEIPDGVLNEFLTRSTYDVKKKCFAYDREILINPDTINSIKRYYFGFSPTKTNNRLGYLTDWNLDGTVAESDIVVYEKDSTGAVRTDITSRIDTLDTELGYFTLDTGYPSNSSYKVYASYSWMNFLITDEYIKYDIKRLIMHLTMIYIIEWYRNQIRRGIVKQTLGGLTIERSAMAWNELEERHLTKAKEFITRFKPLLWSTASDQSAWHGSGAYYGYGSYYNTGNYSPYYSKY